MSGTTKTLLLLGAVGLGYYLYTTTISNGKKEVVQQQQQLPGADPGGIKRIC